VLAALVIAFGIGVFLQARPGKAGGETREYWIAAVPVTWHVAPNERDAIVGEDLDPKKTTFQTVVYRQFTKDWGKQIPNEEGDRGIQGPLIHAQVGDTILIHFENLDTVFNRPHSMHFHGVHYRPSSDGAYVPGFVNVIDDECGSGTGPGPIVTGVAKKPLPWFVPSYL